MNTADEETETLLYIYPLTTKYLQTRPALQSAGHRIRSVTVCYLCSLKPGLAF